MTVRQLEEGTEEIKTICQVWKDPASGSAYSLGDFEVLSESDYRFTLGENIPHFHKLKRQGRLLPMTSFRQWETSGIAYGHYNTSYPSGEKRWSVGNCPLNPSEGWNIKQEDLESILEGLDPSYFLQAAAAKIYSSGWDALTFAAEFGKVVAMFRGFVRRLINALVNRRTEDVWLEIRYGWRTLYYDMKDIEEAIQELGHKRKRYSEHVGTTTSSSDIHTYTYAGTSATQYWTRRTEWEVGLRGSVVADIEPAVTSFNPFITAWELITLSFVVDWCLNVGQWLAAMSFVVFQTKSASATGIKIVGKRYVTLDRTEFNTNYSGQHFTSTEHTAVFTQRTPASIPLSPLPQVRLSVEQIRDLLMMLRKAIRHLSKAR